MTDNDTNVDELEAQVEEQAQMIDALRTKLAELSQVLPEHDRRQFLKAGAGAGAVLASGAIGRASAAPGDDGDTLWGSDSNRDDVYRDEVDANLVRTEERNGTQVFDGTRTFSAALSDAGAGGCVIITPGIHDISASCPVAPPDGVTVSSQGGKLECGPNQFFGGANDVDMECVNLHVSSEGRILYLPGYGGDLSLIGGRWSTTVDTAFDLRNTGGVNLVTGGARVLATSASGTAIAADRFTNALLLDSIIARGDVQDNGNTVVGDIVSL